MNDMFLTFRQFELSSRNHVLLLGCRHRVVEQGRLVGVFLFISTTWNVELVDLR
jgi:hypothetical protein